MEARRATTAVAEVTATANLDSYYRFLGFLRLKNLVPHGVHLSLNLLAHPSAPDWISRYGAFMKDDRALAYSTMANYLSSLYSLSLYVFESTDNFDVPDAVRNTDHTVA